MTDKQKIEKSNNVSNKEALKDKIHEIHNYLRNNGAGYGMNALKVFNILYGLKKIEEKNLIDKVKLKRPECEFSYLLKLANQNKVEELAELIFKNVLDSINTSSIKNLLLYEIPTIIKGSTLTYLIKEIDKITIIEKTCNVLLSGKIYEYFIGRDETAISELGAYFTDRHIVDYCYNKLDPKINKDGSCNTMIDMFGGSGGFTTGYINYLNDNNKVIDWQQNIDKIYHYDMNEDVVKSAGLEIFCSTGILPNINNVAYKNSFTDSFNDKKFTYIITNPPYGGDKLKYTDTCNKRTKIKEYIKKELLLLKDKKIIKIRNLQLKEIEQEEIKENIDNDKNKISMLNSSQRIINYGKKNKISGKDKESVSLILIMELLEKSGTAICVLKEGVFFNKLYKDLRKCLIENFNVREIISIPQDQFENTSTKTSIIIFDNTDEKTVKVKFYDLIVTHYSEDKFEEINKKIVIVENKDDISSISDKLICEVSKEEILKNPIYSLNYKEYYTKKINICKNFNFCKLGDIYKILPMSKHNTNISKISGKYKFYNSSQNSDLYVDFCDIKEYSIIIGQLGIFNIHFDINFTPSKHVCVIQNLANKDKDNDKILLKYLYYILPELQKTFITNGSTINWLNKTNIYNINVPIPNSKQIIIEYINKISEQNEKKKLLEVKFKNLEEIIKNNIKNVKDYYEDELGNICNLIDGYDFYRNEMDDRKIFIKNENLPLLKIGSNDISDYIKINKKYEKYIVNKNDIVIGTKGTCGKIRKVIIEKGYYKHGTLKFDKFTINKYYIYYYLLDMLNNEFIEHITTKSVLSSLKKEKLLKLKIKIPKNKQLIKDFEYYYKELEKLHIEIENVEILYKQFINELYEKVFN